MSYMFQTAESFNQRFDRWDMSSVEKISFMFREAYRCNQYAKEFEELFKVNNIA